MKLELTDQKILFVCMQKKNWLVNFTCFTWSYIFFAVVAEAQKVNQTLKIVHSTMQVPHFYHLETSNQKSWTNVIYCW